jgi:hypothetical protein
MFMAIDFKRLTTALSDLTQALTGGNNVRANVSRPSVEQLNTSLLRVEGDILTLEEKLSLNKGWRPSTLVEANAAKAKRTHMKHQLQDLKTTRYALVSQRDVLLTSKG